MIWSHLKTIVWLRWRLGLKRWRRSSMLGSIVAVLMIVGSILAGFIAFIVALTVGVGALDDVPPDVLLLIWDAVIVAFLFFWLIGLVTELQRSEALSLDKLLHLPISLRVAFLLNYASSLLSMSLIVFIPAMVGLALALVIVRGPVMLAVLPLIVTFIVMVTALTYQFRGWLAALMANKRRRGTIVAVATISIIVMAQLPQLLNLAFMRSGRESQTQHHAAIMELDRQRGAGEITAEQASEQMKTLNEEHTRATKERKELSFARVVDTAVVANLVVPVGWLPYGARSAAAGRLWPAFLGSLGLLLIGAVSLGRSYRTTLRLHTGGIQSRRRKAKTAAPVAPRGAPAGPLLVERTLPWCSEHAAAVALSSFRSFVRAPQAKMLLLTPIILFALFGTMLLVGKDTEVPEPMVPLIGLGVVALTVFFLAQLVQNIFGFDRDGFRVYVLSPVARRDVLLGKNLALAPVALSIGLVALIAYQFIVPQQIAHLLAAALQLVCVFVICSMVGNVVSILAPVAMSPGTLKPARPKSSTMLKQMVFAFLFPIAMLPTVIPLGLELALDAAGWRAGVPVYLLLTAIELPLVLWVYRRVLSAEGRLLQHREQRILEDVTAGVE
ncbi:MAG: ABC transporter permease [Planctomycetes bacterium]|nr:ABC transporter permease [Planctomycetota bacterium]